MIRFKTILFLIIVSTNIPVPFANASSSFRAHCYVSTVQKNPDGKNEDLGLEFSIDNILRESGTYIGDRAVISDRPSFAPEYKAELGPYSFKLSIFQAGTFGEGLTHGYFIDLKVSFKDQRNLLTHVQGASQRVLKTESTHQDAEENRMRNQMLFVMTQIPESQNTANTTPFMARCWLK